jgi:hypothetical protein
MEGIRILRSDRSPVWRGSYPNIDGNPIPGFEFGGSGNEEWLIIVRHSYIGEYDPRYYEVTTMEDAIADRIEHPEYPGVGQWVIRENLVKLETTIILDNLENVENLINNQVMKQTKQLKNIVVSLRAILRKVLNNSNISNAEQKAIDFINNAGKKFLDNRQVRKDKKALIEDTLHPELQEPDMDLGWSEEEEAENL